MAEMLGKVFRALVFLWVVGSADPLLAQVAVRLAVLQKGYLRWAPTHIGVEVVNLSGEPLLLHSTESKSWLRFLVRRGNLSSPGVLVRQVQPFLQPDLALEPGEIARFRFDLTPFYSIRELGAYVVQAVVSVSDVEGEKDLVSEPVEISVVPGRVIWSADFGGGTIARRCYSLLRHVVGAEELLYALIEVPEEGLVYMCRPLGRLSLGRVPQSAVDALGNWSILFRSGPRQFDYFEFSPNAELLRYERRMQVEEPPRLVGGPGGYTLVGGVQPSQIRQETLKSTQPQFIGAETGEKPTLQQQLPTAQFTERAPRQKRQQKEQQDESASAVQVKRYRS